MWVSSKPRVTLLISCMLICLYFSSYVLHTRILSSSTALIHKLRKRSISLFSWKVFNNARCCCKNSSGHWPSVSGTTLSTFSQQYDQSRLSDKSWTMLWLFLNAMFWLVMRQCKAWRLSCSATAEWPPLRNQTRYMTDLLLRYFSFWCTVLALTDSHLTNKHPLQNKFFPQSKTVLNDIRWGFSRAFLEIGQH